MSDDDQRTFLAMGENPVHESVGCFFVQPCRWFIQKENGSRRGEGKGNQKPLALPAGKQTSIFSQGTVERLGQLQDFLLELCLSQSVPYGFFVDIRIEAPEIFPGGVMEDIFSLKARGKGRADIFGRKLPIVLSPQLHTTLIGFP